MGNCLSNPHCTMTMPAYGKPAFGQNTFVVNKMSSSEGKLGVERELIENGVNGLMFLLAESSRLSVSSVSHSHGIICTISLYIVNWSRYKYVTNERLLAPRRPILD